MRTSLLKRFTRKFSDLNTFMNSLPPETRSVMQRYASKHTNPSQYNHQLMQLPIPEDIPRPDYMINVDNPVYQNPSTTSCLYSEEEADGIREAAQVVARALTNLENEIEVGMSADDADRLIHEFIVQEGAYPSGVGFMGFPRSVCISPNDGRFRLNC